MHKSTILVAVLAAASLLAGCEASTQTTSGRAWLAAYPSAPPAGSNTGNIDARVRAVAAVEPLLRFPARIGIARVGKVDEGRYFAQWPGLVALPAAEAKSWAALRDRLGPGFGQFVPISPMIASMVEENVPPNQMLDQMAAARHLIETIRLAAARQHLDAVLVYEVDATADARSNPLSIGEWTLIGSFILPSQDVKAVGVAQAMLIDVRNGYPYGQITSTVDDKTESARFEIGDAKATMTEKVQGAAVAKLADEAYGMMDKLKVELAAK
jgi:hypothetical protein